MLVILTEYSTRNIIQTETPLLIIFSQKGIKMLILAILSTILMTSNKNKKACEAPGPYSRSSRALRRITLGNSVVGTTKRILNN